MGFATPPSPLKPPAPADLAKAQINALAYAALQKKLRQSTGRKASFITAGGSSLLGQ